MNIIDDKKLNEVVDFDNMVKTLKSVHPTTFDSAQLFYFTYAWFMLKGVICTPVVYIDGLVDTENVRTNLNPSISFLDIKRYMLASNIIEKIKLNGVIRYKVI